MVLSVGLLLAPLAAAAAQPIDELIVTAARRETAVGTLAESISIAGSETVARRALLVDSIDSMAGGYVQRTTPGQGAAIIRGQRGSSVLHLIDGMRINNAIFRSAPTQYFAFIPLTAVERVELIRGTPASLYGSDAVGGAIQVVSRRPDFSGSRVERRGELRLDYDSATMSRRVSGNVDAGSALWQASLSGEYFTAEDRQVGGGERIAPTAYRARAGRAYVAYSPSFDTSVSFDLQTYSQPETPRIDELVPGFGEDTPASSEFFFEPNERHYAHLNWRSNDGFKGLDWNASLAWQRIVDDRRTRAFGADERRLENNRSDLYGVLLTAGDGGAAADWIAGVEVYTDRVSSRRQVESLDDASRRDVASRYPDGSTVDQAAVFVNGSFSASDAVVLSAGLRLNTVDVDLPAGESIAATAVSNTDWSGDVGLLADIGTGWDWTVNIGAGFRSPNVFDLGSLGERPGNRFNVPNTSLDSERALHVDTGFRYRGDQWAFDAVLFWLDYRDRITSVGTGEQTAAGRDIVTSVNAASSEVAGLEIGASLALSAGLSLSFNVLATRGEQRLADGVTEAADRIPPLSMNAMLEWTASDRLSASLRLRGAARQDRLSARDVRDPRINPNGTPGWAELGARVDLTPDERWLVSLGVSNLLDKRYRVHGSGVDAVGRSVSVVIRRQFAVN